jgi:tRNA U38,U39,U40 pseudouridine synthase TruA
VTIPLHGFRLGLSSPLPPQIAVVDAVEVSADFHARFSARGKRYRYTLLNRRDPSPLLPPAGGARARSTWSRPGGGPSDRRATSPPSAPPAAAHCP